MTYMLLVVAIMLRSGTVRMVMSVVDSEALSPEVIFAIIPRLVGVFICYDKQQTPRLRSGQIVFQEQRLPTSHMRIEVRC